MLEPDPTTTTNEAAASTACYEPGFNERMIAHLKIDLTHCEVRCCDDESYVTATEVIGRAAGNKIATSADVEGWCGVQGELAVHVPVVIREASVSRVTCEELHAAEGCAGRGLVIELAVEYFDALCEHLSGLSRSNLARIGEPCHDGVRFETDPQHQMNYKEVEEDEEIENWSGVATYFHTIVSMSLGGRTYQGESRIDGELTHKAPTAGLKGRAT